MTPFAQVKGHLPADDVLNPILEKANIVLGMTEGISSCHEVAAEFVKRTGLGTVVRGHFCEIYEHSWVDMGTWILDIYPVGGCRPHVLTKLVGSHHLYRTEIVEAPQCDLSNVDRVEFKL